MAADLKGLLARKAQLDALIAEARQAELTAAISEVRALVAEFNLTSTDVFGRGQAPKKERASVPPKYRDPATGKTWTGRGKAPTWIAGKDRSAFAI